MLQIKIILFVVFVSTSIIHTSAVNSNKQIIYLGKHKLIVELARSDIEHKKGLMYRRNLKQNKGMLFIFKRSDYLSFWMKNTYIPLDIGFFDKEGKLLEYKSMNPLSLEIIMSSKKAKYALEVNKGFFKGKKINIGTKITFLR